MEASKMKEKFESLYNFMKNSGDVKNMKTFGHVMKEMFEYTITNHPDMAEEYLNELEAIKYRNYLTKIQAQKIIDGMRPAAPWDYDTWVKAMDDLGFSIDDFDGADRYNRYALWCEMNKMYSDHKDTVASLIGKTIDEIPINTIVTAAHDLAIDNLTDPDGVYSISKYFSSIL